MKYRRSNRKTYRRKPVAKKKVDRKQSRQITRLQRAQYAKVYTQVDRNQVAIGPVVTTPWGNASCYIQPINPAMEQTVASGRKCHDNTNVALLHSRKFLWGIAAEEFNVASPWDGGSLIKTTYCKLNYRLQSNETNMCEVCVAVISPKKRFADQITLGRQFMQTATTVGATPPGLLACSPGSKSVLVRDVDFSVSGDTASATQFGCTFNKQLWDVHYQRTHRLQAPSTAATSQNEVGITDTSHAPNDQFGVIRLPMNTSMRAGLKDLAQDGATGYASHAQYTSVPKEQMKYLVVVSNDGVGNQSIYLTTSQNFTHQVYNSQITGAP
jgi:hypothetical protein